MPIIIQWILFFLYNVVITGIGGLFTGGASVGGLDLSTLLAGITGQ